MRSVVPKIHRREHTQKVLEEQEKHTVIIDQDGDVVMDEWTKCIYCVSELT